MAVLTGFKKGLGIEIRKKLGHSGAPDPKGIYGIYRVRHRWGKVIQEKLPFYVPTNPQTEAQQANRQKMADAVAAWQSLTPEQKEIYNERAKGKNLTGNNIFISEYLLSH